MKFTLDWLREHLETDASLDQILAALNDIGLEVEGVENPAERFAGFRIAKVLTAAPHPQADKLQVLTVDPGDGTPLQVVCGAPNARAGLIGVFGTEGAVVPANGMVLRKAAIRGVESNGMMCSTRELELGEDHEGIIELPADAPVGTAFADYAGLDDPVIDLSITPNRQDCMGVRGVARDLAAKGIGTLKPLTVPEIAGQGPGPDVRTDDPDGCPAFFARTVTGVPNGAASDWMPRRLTAVGPPPLSARHHVVVAKPSGDEKPALRCERGHRRHCMHTQAVEHGERIEARQQCARHVVVVVQEHQQAAPVWLPVA